MGNGMRQSELKPCCVCRKGVAHGQQWLSTRVRITRMGVNIGAVQWQAGLEMMLGGCAALATVMGADEEMLSAMSDEVTVLVCDECARQSTVADLLEAAERFRAACPEEKSGEASA